MLLAKKQTGIGKENLFDVYLTKIAERFSPLLKLDPIKRGKLALTRNLYAEGTIYFPHCGSFIAAAFFILTAFWIPDTGTSGSNVVFYLLQGFRPR